MGEKLAKNHFHQITSNPKIRESSKNQARINGKFQHEKYSKQRHKHIHEFPDLEMLWLGFCKLTK